MGGGHDSVGVEESTTAPGTTVVGDADDEGEFTSAGRSSANDLGAVLRVGSSSNQRGRESNEGSDLDHCDEVGVIQERELKSEVRLMRDDLGKGSFSSFIYTIVNLLYISWPLPSQDCLILV